MPGTTTNEDDMISVNVGDVIEAAGHEGQWTALYEGAAVDTETNETRYIWYCTPVDEPDKNETRIWWADVTRNVTADKAKAAAEKKTAGCKFWYATRLNDAAVELGAETLPELYALMAATGVQLKPTYTQQWLDQIAALKADIEKLKTPRTTVFVADDVQQVRERFDWNAFYGSPPNDPGQPTVVGS